MKQKITIALSLILVTFLIFWACQDDELPQPSPGVSNKIVFTHVNSDSVSYREIDVSVTIDNVADENIKEHGICYSTVANPTESDSKVQQGSLSGNTYSCSIENLEPNTSYHVRAYLKFKEAIAYSEDFTIKTNALQVPEVEKTNLLFGPEGSLQIKGKVTDYGGDTINTKGVCWSFKQNPSMNDSVIIDTLKCDTISLVLKGINTDSIYYLKMFAINSVGAGYSNEIVFNTNNLPQITTGSVSDISNTGAICGGTISDNGGSNITARGVCWSTNNNPTLADSYTQDGTGTGTFISTLSNLDAATVYYVRAYATNKTGTIYGNEQEFTTTGLPVLTTAAVLNVTSTTATTGGNISDDGGYTITARGVCWSTSTEPTLDDNYTEDGTGTGSYTSNLTELSVNTTYYVRAYATNANGTRYGNEYTFTSHDGTPILTTTDISNLTTNSATSGGNITSDEGNAVTVRGVCWSTSSNPTISDNTTSEGSGTGSFVSNLSGLTINLTYYLRAYATNSIGTNYGNEISFTTKDGIPTITTTAAYNITTTTATCGGNITDDGGLTITARGVCWNTSTNPTISDPHTTNGSGTGNYTSSVTGLTEWTTYHVRAYATNSYGTAYGNELSFTTIGETISDYDGNIYETIKIGSQVWMAENLKTTHYEDGTVINLVEDVTAWSNLSATDKAMCYYDNSTTNKETYGVLYTWAAAMNGAASSTSNPSGVQGVCPDGWHIPSDEEWKEMEMFIGMNQVQADTTGYRGTNEGSKIAGNESLWISGTLTSNAEFGRVDFIALPGGYRPFTGEFMSLRNLGAFWSSTESNSASATVRFLNSDYSKICRYGWTKPRGTSIRCIKD